LPNQSPAPDPMPRRPVRALLPEEVGNHARHVAARREALPREAAEVLNLLLDNLCKRVLAEVEQRPLGIAAPQSPGCRRVAEDRLLPVSHQRLEHRPILQARNRGLLGIGSAQSEKPLEPAQCRLSRRHPRGEVGARLGDARLRRFRLIVGRALRSVRSDEAGGDRSGCANSRCDYCWRHGFFH
jgi:hypothetical protein